MCQNKCKSAQEMNKLEFAFLPLDYSCRLITNAAVFNEITQIFTTLCLISYQYETIVFSETVETDKLYDFNVLIYEMQCI